MEFGKGLKLMLTIIEGGKHTIADEKEILNYMCSYLRIVYDDTDLKLNSEIIETAYEFGVKYLNAKKEGKKELF